MHRSDFRVRVMLEEIRLLEIRDEVNVFSKDMNFGGLE